MQARAKFMQGFFFTKAMLKLYSDSNSKINNGCSFFVFEFAWGCTRGNIYDIVTSLITDLHCNNNILLKLCE